MKLVAKRMTVLVLQDETEKTVEQGYEIECKKLFFENDTMYSVEELDGEECHYFKTDWELVE